MPDICMCPSVVCPVRATCRRSTDSGTRPWGWRQAWFARPVNYPGPCDDYWPTRERTDNA
jgi:hypothetical protein